MSLGAFFLVCSCMTGGSERTATTSAALTNVTQDANVSQDSTRAFCETSGTVVQTSTGRNVVWHYNATTNLGNGWGVSTNQGVSYTHHVSDEAGAFKWPTNVTLPDGFKIDWYAGDPTAVATGWPNQVAFTTLVASKYIPPAGQPKHTYVMLLLSTDGGMHFGTTSTKYFVVSIGSTGGAADQPIAAADTTSGDVYVSWRKLFTNTYLRRIKISSTGVITADPAQDITGALPAGLGTPFNTGFTGNMNIAVGPNDPATGNRQIYFAYPSDVDGLDPMTFPLGCGSLSDIWQPGADRAMTWYLSTAQLNSNNAFTFTAPQPIDLGGGNTVDSWWPCCTAPVLGAENSARPQIAYAAGPNARIAVVISRSWIKTGDSTPANTGTRAMLYESANGTTWDSWMPMCKGYGDLGNILGNLGQPPAEEPFCMQFAPSLATYSNSNLANPHEIAWAWHDTRDPTAQVAIFAGTAITGPTYIPNQTLNVLTDVGIMWPQASVACVHTPWGDYEGMASDPLTGHFYAAWGDNRAGPSQHTGVWSARFDAP